MSFPTTISFFPNSVCSPSAFILPLEHFAFSCYVWSIPPEVSGGALPGCAQERQHVRCSGIRNRHPQNERASQTPKGPETPVEISRCPAPVPLDVDVLLVENPLPFVGEVEPDVLYVGAEAGTHAVFNARHYTPRGWPQIHTHVYPYICVHAYVYICAHVYMGITSPKEADGRSRVLTPTVGSPDIGSILHPQGQLFHPGFITTILDDATWKMPFSTQFGHISTK